MFYIDTKDDIIDIIIMLLILHYVLLTDKEDVIIINNGSNQLTIVCGHVDSECFLSYESNKIISYLTFKLNTTTIVSLYNNLSSAGLFEISTSLNNTQLVWICIFQGIIKSISSMLKKL